MADASRKDEEVKHRMHVPSAIKAIKHGTGDVHHALGNNPRHGSSADTVHERLERHQHLKPHSHETERLDVTVFFQMAKTDYCTSNGT